MFPEMVTSGQYLGVVMGDLVRSEQSLAPEMLHEWFNEAVDWQNAAHAQALASPLTITLGDEFQGVTRSLGRALPIMRDLRLRLMARAIECRFVIGLVEIRTAVNPDKAWNMMGPGLGHARDKLNEKKGGMLYRFSLPHDPLAETVLDALGVGLTTIERGWTDRQRSDIDALVGGASPAELARCRDVSVHSIYKVRSSGHYDAYVTQWQAIEAALAALDAREGLV